MRNFQLALVACSLLACEAAPPATPMTESDVSLALAPLPCGAPLPPMTSWNGKAPSPLPLPETEQGVVLIVDHPSDDQLRWAFSVDVDQITGWAELRADRVGELVRLVESAKQGVADFVVFIPILSIVKVRPPMGPRLSDYVLANAALQREMTPRPARTSISATRPKSSARAGLSAPPAAARWREPRRTILGARCWKPASGR